MRVLNQEQIIELLDFLVEQNIFGENEFIYKGKMFFIKGGEKVDSPEENAEVIDGEESKAYAENAKEVSFI